MTKNLITNTIIYGIFIILVWLMAIPAWSNFREVRKEAVLKKETIVLEQQVIDKLNSISQVLESKKDNVARLEQAIPADEFKPEMLSMMEHLASQNGLGLTSISVESSKNEVGGVRTLPRVGEAKPAGSLGTLKVTMETSGTYSSFKNWLNAVERNLRIIDVSDISFTVEDKKTAEGETIPAVDPVMDYTVGMNTYILKK